MTRSFVASAWVPCRPVLFQARFLRQLNGFTDQKFWLRRGLPGRYRARFAVSERNFPGAWLPRSMQRIPVGPERRGGLALLTAITGVATPPNWGQIPPTGDRIWNTAIGGLGSRATDYEEGGAIAPSSLCPLTSLQGLTYYPTDRRCVAGHTLSHEDYGGRVDAPATT